MSTDTDATPEAGRQVPAVQQRPTQVVEHVQPLFDTARFEHMQRAAKALMNSSLLPESVRGASPEQCFSNLLIVFDYAERWKVPAVMLAQCVSIVHNKLMFEGKAIAAALETTLGVRLDYEWTDHEPGHPDYGIRVFGTRPGESTPREVKGTVGQWRTFQKNSQNPNPAWTGAASTMQLAYRGAREWGRLWAPGTMLGVYGDDEMDAWEDRRDRAVTVQAAAAVTSGFAAPSVAPNQAADEEDIQDAEVEEIDEGEAQEGAQETTASGDQQTGDGGKATSGDAGPGAGASGAKAGKKDKPPAETDAERSVRLYDEGHNAGMLGVDFKVPAKLKGQDAEDWTSGYHAGAAEKMEDQGEGDDDGGDDDTFTGDEADAEVDSGEEEADELDPATQSDLREAAENFLDDMAAPIDPFAAFMEGIKQLNSWADIKAGFSALSKSEAWKAALSQPRAPLVRQARICAWLRMEELKAAGKETLDVISDLTAFRCWVETTDDPDAIHGNWRVLVDQPLYTALQPEQKRKLEQAIMARMKELREPPLDPSLS